MGNRIKFRPEGSRNQAEIVGIDYGGRIEVVGMNEETIVLKVHGHMAWNGRAELWKYVSSRFLVYRLGLEAPDGSYAVTPLAEIPMRPTLTT